MNDIDKIKDLLFGHEKKALDAITRRLEIPESRTADISDVLPESVLRSHADKRLAPALQEPVEQCLKESIRRDPEDFADALFPVIGPAIRKSISEALRSMVQSLNQTIENSMSLRTRYQAWRAGVPLGQFILQRNILYRVEEVFLIKREDGLLVEHLQHDDVVSTDSDAVSAMFTAIQDFIHDSFSQGENETLTTAVMGELALWAVHGPKAILVCVIRGVAQASLRTQLREILEQIHLRHGEAVASFDGGTRLSGVTMELDKCLTLERRKDTIATEAARRKLPLPALLLLAAIVLLAGWVIFSRYMDARQLASFRDALDATPGIVVNDIQRKGGKIVVRGLRDPLSGAPSDIAPGSQIEPAELRLELAPYQSLDTAIVERRARRILQPPPGVGLHLEGNRLRLSGSAPMKWKQRVQTLAVALPGVDFVDTSRMSMSDMEVFDAAMSELQPPDSVVLEVQDGVLSASGFAPQSWLLESNRRIPSIVGLRSGDLLGIAVEERMRIAELLSVVDGTQIFFAGNDILLAGEDVVLDQLTTKIRQISSLAARLSSTPQIRIRGYSDGTGAAELNRVVELARADRVAQWLVDAGVSPAAIQTQATGSAATGSGVDPALRRVEITIGVIEVR
ncbi:MAG: OmpA family protein [Gammaproteobacteria bacterium]|nr:OmpA family protein [Gammaproteobacteria bacterium]